MKLHSKKLREGLSFAERHSHLYLLPIILVIAYLIISFLVASISQRVSAVKLSLDDSKRAASSYPYFSTGISPYLTAESAIIMDKQSKVVLFEKNSKVRFSMASTTKVMTALVGLDHYKPDDILIARRSGVEGVNVGVSIGEKMRFSDALYALLLPSGNDIAYLIADNYPGGKDAFIAAMNQKATALKFENTHYADPAGLNDDGNYTTAFDLARLADSASNNPTMVQVMGTKNQFITDISGVKKYNLVNLNKFIGAFGVIGGKTGYTEGAEGVLMTIANIKNREYVIVVMRSEDRFADTQTLLLPLQNGVSIFNPKE